MATQASVPRTPFAPPRARAGGGASPQRPVVAGGWALAARILVAPFAAALLAFAGLLYVLLLPVCGIASVANALARAAWSTLREGAGGVRPRASPRT